MPWSATPRIRIRTGPQQDLRHWACTQPVPCGSAAGFAPDGGPEGLESCEPSSWWSRSSCSGCSGTLLLASATGATIAVAGYAYFSKDLPDPRQALEALVFTQQTKVYDRTGAVLLASLGTDRRVPVTFDQIPGELVDATTAIEDKTFWDNSGFDPAGFVAAAIDTINGRDRGGSTITQQLVKKRLLPESAFANGPYQRKVAEIIQSIRLTEAYPGPAGKEAIMAAYLNDNFYGNRSYGVAAAARSYWNKDLKDLTLAECALLAGIPQSPPSSTWSRTRSRRPTPTPRASSKRGWWCR